jgi:D-alanine-D-alanine ligase
MMRVGITYNLKSDFSHKGGEPADLYEEFDAEETIEAIQSVLEADGAEVVKLGGDPGVIDRLMATPVDLVFNIAEGLGGRNREGYIPSLLEFLGIPYTGSDPLTLSLTLDKALAKRVVAAEGVPTPGFRKVTSLTGLEGLSLRYPLFVKPCYEGSSKGVRLDSKVSDSSSLREKTRWLLKEYGPPVLVEEFVSGPEFTVGILGNAPPSVLGVMEIEIVGTPPDEAIYSLEVKREWKEKVRYHCPPRVAPAVLERIETVALQAYRALECRDVSRVDVRLGQDGIPYFLEVNPLPGLSPLYGDLPIMARRMGWDYGQLVRAIYHHALRRSGLEGKVSS